MEHLSIRKAVAEDVDIILDLVQQLADYEKEPDAVVSTREDYLRDGFGEDPLFRCLIAEWEGKPVGFSLYFFKWSTWTGKATLHLEDLFVSTDYRGKKIGIGLLKCLASIAVEKKCVRFEWEVLDWNTPARDFYHSIGAFHREGWYPYRIVGDALNQLAADAPPVI